ncbi:MAG TPA: MBL fold metallo-hydrolase [Candidatus Acidoferrales bacterium]
MRKAASVLLAAALLIPIALVHSQELPQGPQDHRTLDIYFIDTEGGQATLFVSPSGESMLVDTGFAGNAAAAPSPAAAGPAPTAGAPAAPPAVGRDAERILAVLKQANVTVLDYVVITHYHGDHVGGAAELASRIPIRNFVDHGPYTVELQPNRSAGFVAYRTVRDRARAIVPKPGDQLPIAGLDVLVVSSASALMTTPIPGAPAAGAPNPLCRNARLKVPDPTPENTESIGLVVRYGNFRLLNLGDLTWNQEHQLVCPDNLLGTFDVFHTTRHGDPNSGAPQMVHALRARIAVMNNGERKGGAPEYWQMVRDAPGLGDLWQLHRSAAGAATHNSPEQFLANLNETDHGHHLKLSARADGSFVMTNERTQFTKEYPERATRATRTSAP